MSWDGQPHREPVDPCHVGAGGEEIPEAAGRVAFHAAYGSRKTDAATMGLRGAVEQGKTENGVKRG